MFPHIYLFTLVCIYLFMFLSIYSCLYLFVFTSIHAYICSYLYISARVYLHISSNSYICLCLCIFANDYIYNCLCLHVFIQVYICSCLSISTYACLYMFIHVYYPFLFVFASIWIYLLCVTVLHGYPHSASLHVWLFVSNTYFIPLSSTPKSQSILSPLISYFIWDLLLCLLSNRASNSK